ncbi:YoaK family protein [Zobellia amurskyensis]|uniref:YoaK family protein n=1 Tax=Zobellia amurskyensis TaxID=248905 RepID=UPI0030B83E3B
MEGNHILPLHFLVSFGSFLSSFLIEKYRENKKHNVFILPAIIECLILITIGLLSNIIVIEYPNLIVCLLLFAMGLQNSFVTKISNAIVRTTHLTGLFTDLGIDISQLFFPKSHPQRAKLKSNIKLRVYIILFFFAGGIVGGLFYSRFNLELNTLIFAALILISSLFYDDLRYRLIRLKRTRKQKRTYI